jgi:LPXTG-motif cell wall-anchored protein
MLVSMLAGGIAEAVPSQEYYGTIVVRKWWSSCKQATGPLAGVTFKLYYADDSTREVPLRVEVTNTEGLAFFSMLLPGSYVVVEIGWPSGYMPSCMTEQPVSLAPGETKEVTFWNMKVSGSEPQADGKIKVTAVKTDGGAVDGLLVNLSGDAEAIKFTGPSGALSIYHVSAGNYAVNVKDLGYTSDGPKSVSLATDGSEAEVRLVLTPEPPPPGPGAIKGQVTEKGSGLSLKGVRVQALGIDGERYGSPVSTDETGRYLISGVTAGEYRVEAGLDGYETAVSGAASVPAETTVTVDLELGREQGVSPVVVPPEPPAGPPELPKTGLDTAASTLGGALLLVVGLALNMRRRR